MHKAPLDSVKMDNSWKTMLNALDSALLVLNEDWGLEFANASARALLACRDDEELAACWGGALREHAAAAFSAAEDLQAGDATEFELELPGAERPRRLRLEWFPLDEERRQRALILRDLDLVPADAGDLRLIGRYRSLARLYRTLGHDLKGPLNAMTINMDLLKTCLTRFAPADPALRERQARYLKVLDEELGRMSRSLQTFLAQAVPPTQEAARPFSLREVLMDLVSLVASQARAQQVALEVQMDEQTITLEGWRDLLKQALLNLAINALEAMPTGGRLTIKLESRLDRAVILFQDTGAGIAPEALDRIWDLNYTTKKTGSGIGLYVARSVIESFGGAISVECRPAQGACFTVSLPITLKEGAS